MSALASAPLRHTHQYNIRRLIRRRTNAVLPSCPSALPLIAGQHSKRDINRGLLHVRVFAFFFSSFAGAAQQTLVVAMICRGVTEKAYSSSCSLVAMISAIHYNSSNRYVPFFCRFFGGADTQTVSIQSRYCDA